MSCLQLGVCVCVEVRASCVEIAVLYPNLKLEKEIVQGNQILCYGWRWYYVNYTCCKKKVTFIKNDVNICNDVGILTFHLCYFFICFCPSSSGKCWRTRPRTTCILVLESHYNLCVLILVSNVNSLHLAFC